MTQSELDDYQDADCIDHTDPETLHRLYWGEELTLQEIADAADVSVDTIWRWMDKNDIDRRRSGGGPKREKPDSDVDYTDPGVLDRLYNEEGLSQPDIAEMAGVTHQTIDHHMKEHEIERRDRIQSSRWARRKEYAYRSISDQGYVEYEDTWDGDGSKIALHRLLAISEYGVEAVSGMDVHHKNKIPWDNRPDNIELMTKSEHARHHNEQGDIGHGSGE